LAGLRVAALTKTSYYNVDREYKKRERREEKRREEREINHYDNMKPGQRKSDIIW
jgi:hypothetical protein